MTPYLIRVALPETVTSVSSPPTPVPPVPSPDDHRQSFRCSCLVKYYEARLTGLDHLPAIRETARLLRQACHPWSSLDVVTLEINQALGRRPGRPRRSQP